MRALIFILILQAAFTGAVKAAEFSPFFQNSAANLQWHAGSRLDLVHFIVPNEYQPAHAKPIWRKSPKGVYISVGTERGFIGAAYSNATHLLLVDSSKGVVLFNRMNIMLLKASRGNHAQFKLWRQDPNVILRDLAKMPITAEEKSWLAEMVNSTWWQIVASEFRRSPFYLKSAGLEAVGVRNAFEGAKYQEDEIAFKKLHQMAKAGRIQAEQFHLDKPGSVDRLKRRLRATNVPISVMDLSNAWWERYIGREKTRDLILKLGPLAQPDAFVMLTDRPLDDRNPSEYWHYFYQDFSSLKSGRFQSMSFNQSEPDERHSESNQYLEDGFMRNFKIVGYRSCRAFFTALTGKK